MTIAEVSQKYNLTPDTLRYHERIGLIAKVPRNSNRIYEFIWKRKNNSRSQKKLLEEQREKLQEKQRSITETLARLDYKIGLYNEIIEGKRKDFTEDI